MSKAEQIATALGGAKKTADGWVAKCPCHDDTTASLSVKDTDNADGVLVNCFANCEWKTIKEALNQRNLLTRKTPAQNVTTVRRHIYTDEAGNYLFEKIKRSDGKIFSRIDLGNGDYAWSLKNLRKPLYALPGLIAGIAAGKTVYVTEGEKDADYLIRLGLVATTSVASSSWAPEYSEILRTARGVVIFPDNDEPGAKIAAKRFAAIRKINPNCKIVTLPSSANNRTIKDVADFIDAGGTLDNLLALVEATPGAPETKKQKREYATRQDYTIEIQKFFGDVRRCIFSDDLCYLDKHSQLWSPAANKIRALRSEIKEISQSGNLIFRPGDVEDHLYALENSMPPQFVIDVPEWDGRDRIAELATRIVLKPYLAETMINNTTFEELLKYWHTKTWQRLYNPEIRNEIFILSGPQNIGKDFWIRENCEALGQYLINFSIHSNERDTKEQLHRGLVMNISEFDRTSRSEVSLLKEIVTATQTDLRFAYDRRAVTRVCRCSFIASTNVNDIFNDPTGHSRYVFFELADIRRTERFSKVDRLQVLAQGRTLAEAGYKPSELALDAMRYQIFEHTPDDEYELLVERFDYLCTQKYNSLGHVDRETFGRMKNDRNFSGFFPNNLLAEIVDTLCREYTKSPKKIRSTLKNAGRQRVHSIFGRGFYFNFAIPNHPNQEIEY